MTQAEWEASVARLLGAESWSLENRERQLAALARLVWWGKLRKEGDRYRVAEE
jgi:hypothetical protein